jgi:hypothetical protein
VDTFNTNQVVNVSGAEVAAALDSGEPLSNILDITVTKALPPKGKFLELFNNQMVIGHLIRTITSSDRVLVNQINWSDTSTGGTVENFPALNRDEIGKSTEDITGLFGESDNLQIFKRENVFYLSGTLFDLAYRVRDSLSEGIGCLAHQSIIKVEGGCFFLSDRGVYFSSGGAKPLEFSEIIEPLFEDQRGNLELEKAISVLDRLEENIYLFIPALDLEHIVLQYDFYHKQWFLYKGINATGGFVMHDDELYHSDGVKEFQRQNIYTDDTLPISWKYATSWLNEGSPSFTKKWTRVLLMSILSDSFPVSLKTQENWDDSTDITNIPTFTLGANEIDVDKSLIARSAKSLRFIIEGQTTTTPVKISGMEYDVENTQKAFKGRN